MTALRTAPRTFLAALALAALASCGEPAGQSARFRQPAATDPPVVKGGEPVGALPSHVFSGEVAVFKAAAADSGTAKRGDVAGALPSHLSTGRSAAFRPPAPAGPSAGAVADEAARPPRRPSPE